MSRSVPFVTPKARKDIEEIGLSFVRHCYPAMLTKPQPFPVFSVFEDITHYYSNLESGCAELPPGTEGLFRPDGKVLVDSDTYIALSKNLPRARFTAIHEIGHGVMHYYQLKVALEHGRLRLYRRDDVRPCMNPEWQANRFAASVLMPKPVMDLAFQLELITQTSLGLQRLFQVSAEAAKYRFQDYLEGKI